jgi:hypothetical protein
MDIKFYSDINDLWLDSQEKSKVASDEPVYDKVSPLIREYILHCVQQGVT